MALREIVMNNLGWKLASLVMASLIWFSINTAIEDGTSPRTVFPGKTRTFALPITVRTKATDSRSFIVRPNSVKVKVRGYPDEIDALQTSDLQAFVDLMDVQEAVGLSKKIFVHTPGSVTLESVVPDEVSVDRVSPAKTVEP